MHNAFLVLRTVVFALLTYTHALILVFALWNIVAAKSSGISTPGASVFLLMCSIFILVLVPMAYLAELICVKARPAHVRVECAWTALMSFFQLAASVSVTVDGPPTYCRSSSQWSMCASSSLLVHISWLATLIILSYCLTICVAASTHAADFSDVWITPVSRVPWFHLDIESSAPKGSLHPPTLKFKKSLSSWSEESCGLAKYMAERWGKLSHTERRSGPLLFTNGHQSVDAIQPTWARQHRIRRGVDNPFVKPLPSRKEPPVVLAPLPRIHSRHVDVTSWHSCFTEDSTQSEKTRTSSCWTLTPRTSVVFPQVACDPDLPIPLPRLSEWVRADVRYPRI